MRYLKKISDFVIYGNFWISIGAALMVWETYLLLGEKVDPFYIFFVFAATLCVYNMDRLVVLKGTPAEESDRHIWISRHFRLLTVVTFICALYLLVCLFFMPFKVILFLSHLAVISIAYSVPFIRRKGKWIPLRSLNGLKIFLISYVWMVATGMLPAVAHGVAHGASLSSLLLNASVLSITLRRGLFIFAITIPFDIRDIQSDTEVGIKTLPAMIGVRAAQWLSLVCLMVFVVLAWLDHSLDSPAFWALLISAVTTAPFTLIAQEDLNEYFYTGLLDGTIVFQFLLVWVFYWYW